VQRRLSLQGPEFDPARLAGMYAKIDVFCYPSTSEHGETFGVAVAEAMAAGCVPVVSDLACFQGLVTHEVSGLVFDHRSIDAPDRLAQGLALLLRDGDRRTRFARAAQEYVKQFDFAASATAVLSSLQRIAAV
jgi:glycosyltransferase involved in cell wall biosynthesis